jgi:hypothetical protein
VRAPDLVNSRWDRTSKIVFAVLAAVMLASLPWLVHPYYEANVETNDASMYILSAESLLAGQGYSYVGQPFTVRPPGMSVLLAPILRFRGLDFGAMHLFVNLFGAAGILAMFVWLRPRVGSYVAAALGLFLWLNSGFRHFSNEVMSDVPGVALTFALFLIERWADRSPSWKRDLLLGAAIGLSSYMRTILVLVLPAILLARLWRNLADKARREPWKVLVAQRLAPLCAGTLLLFLPWSLRNSAVGPKGAVDQNFIHSYGVAMLHVDGGDPSSPPRPLWDVARKTPDRASKILSLLGTSMESNAAGIAGIALGSVIVLAVAYLLWTEKRSFEIYFFIVVFVILVYFGYRDRLVLPLFAMGWAALGEVLCKPEWKRLSTQLRRRIAAAALLVLAVLGFHYREGWDELARDHHARIEQARAWNEHLPPDARLASAIGWHHSLYVGRMVHSLYFAIRRRARADDPGDGRPADPSVMKAAEEVIDRYGLNTVILSTDPSDLSMLGYFQRKYGNGVRAGDGWVFRVRS